MLLKRSYVFAGLISLLISVLTFGHPYSEEQASNFEAEYYKNLVTATDPDLVRFEIKTPIEGRSMLSFNENWYIRAIDDGQLEPAFDGYRLVNFPTNMQASLFSLPAWPVAADVEIYTRANAWAYYLKSDVDAIDVEMAKEKWYSRIYYIMNNEPQQRVEMNHSSPYSGNGFIIDNNDGDALITYYSMRSTHKMELEVSIDNGQTFHFLYPIGSGDFSYAPELGRASIDYTHQSGWIMMPIPSYQESQLIFRIYSLSGDVIDSGGSNNYVEVFTDLPADW